MAQISPSYNINDFLPRKITPQPSFLKSPTPILRSHAQESCISQIVRDDLDSDSSSDEDQFQREEVSLFSEFIQQETQEFKKKKPRSTSKKRKNTLMAVQEFIKKTVEEQVQKQTKAREPIQISQPYADISTEQRNQYLAESRRFGTPLHHHSQQSVIMPISRPLELSPLISPPIQYIPYQVNPNHAHFPQYIPITQPASLECSRIMQPVLSPRIPYQHSLNIHETEHQGSKLYCTPDRETEGKLEVRDLSQELELTSNLEVNQTEREYIRRLETQNSQLRERMENLLSDSQQKSTQIMVPQRIVLKETEVQTEALYTQKDVQIATLPPLAPHTRTNSDLQSQRFTNRSNPILTPRSGTESPYYVTNQGRTTEVQTEENHGAFNFTVRMSNTPEKQDLPYLQKEISNYKIEEGTADFRNQGAPIFCEELKEEVYTPESMRSAIHVPSQNFFQSHPSSKSSTPYRYDNENQIESLTVSLEPSTQKYVMRPPTTSSVQEVTPTSTQLKRQSHNLMTQLSESKSYTPETSFVISDVHLSVKKTQSKNSSFLDKVKLIQRSIRSWLRSRKKSGHQPIRIVASKGMRESESYSTSKSHMSSGVGSCEMSSKSSTSQAQNSVRSLTPTAMAAFSSHLLSSINAVRSFKNKLRQDSEKLKSEQLGSFELSFLSASKQNITPTLLNSNPRVPFATSPTSSALLSDDTSIFRSGITPPPQYGVKEVTSESILSQTMGEQHMKLAVMTDECKDKLEMQYSPESLRHTLTLSSDGLASAVLKEETQEEHA